MSIDKKKYRKINELKNWDKNPRAINKDDFDRLKKQIETLGQYKPLIITNDGTVLGGNMRLRAYKDLGIDDVWVSVVDAPDEATKLKYALSDNDRAGYYQEQELVELIASLSDVDLNLFKVDLGKLTSLKDLLKMDDDFYTRNIESPLYEPSASCPDISELVDTTKTNFLIDEIGRADIDEKVKVFLVLCAYRHLVFNYAKVADFYAHSNNDVKDLMRKSALVIIDLNSAIENGFVKLTQELLEIQTGDYA